MATLKEEESKRENILRIKINSPEESKKVQERLFSFGLKWASQNTDVLYQKEDISGIFISKSDFSFTRTNELRGWENCKNLADYEITIQELMSKSFEKKLRKFMILSRL